MLPGTSGRQGEEYYFSRGLPCLAAPPSSVTGHAILMLIKAIECHYPTFIKVCVSVISAFQKTMHKVRKMID